MPLPARPMRTDHKSGKPYFTHPYRVADILADMMMDAPTLAAGLLHDSIEDCAGVDLALLEAEFGRKLRSWWMG